MMWHWQQLKLSLSLLGQSYEERLRACGWPTLEDRRKTGDLIMQTFQLVKLKGVEKVAAEVFFSFSTAQERP